MANFNSPEGDIAQIYLSDTEILERYVGNQLWGWGYNKEGQLGTNNLVHRSSPVQTVAGGTNWKQVSGGTSEASITAAIKTDGTLWVWGSGSQGIQGTNSTTNKSSPVQTVAGGTNWKQVSVGADHVASIKTDGTLWVWGRSTNGRLGTNNAIDRSSPVQTVAGGTNWKQVSAGKASNTAAIKTDGTLWIWGSNVNGQLGTNDSVLVHRSSPVQTVAGGTNWKQVSVGSGHTTAIKTDGTLWIWGSNLNGQLGTNDVVNRSSPTQIGANTNWKQVSAGFDLTTAIKTDGTLWVWGRGTNGILGTNDQVYRSSPVQTVAGGTNWKQVSIANDDTNSIDIMIAAIKTDGTLWVWGSNTTGALGTNDLVHRSSPVQTIAGGTNWKQVSGGNFNTTAITYTES